MAAAKARIVNWSGGPALDRLLENTVQRKPSAPAPTKVARRPFALILHAWASSQVAAYRVGLVLGYAAMMFFGSTAYYAGIPTFTFTTPEGWTPIWATAVVIGAFVASVGSLRAGAEPATKEVRLFNRIELSGAILLFLTLGTYAGVLLIVGYGFSDPSRMSSGSGFLALGVPPTVRMLWLIFHPRVAIAGTNTGPLVHVPSGYMLVRVDDLGRPLPAEYSIRKAPHVEAAPHPDIKGV